MEVSSSTAPRWIKEALKLTVTDVSIFRSHSTRTVSSSKASNAGLSSSSWPVAQQGRGFIISKL